MSDAEDITEEAPATAPDGAVRRTLTAILQAPRHAISGGARGRAFWGLAGAIGGAVLILILIWPLGGWSWLFPPRFDADQTIALPPMPRITIAEQLYLSQRYPDFARGFAERDPQPWAFVPVSTPSARLMFGVKSASKPLLDRAFAILTRDDASRAELAMAGKLIDDVERSEGSSKAIGKPKDRVVVLYHRALVLLRMGQPSDLTAAKDALDRAEKLIADQQEKDAANTRESAEGGTRDSRLAGAEIAVLEARGVVALKQNALPAAEADLDRAVAKAMAARVFPNTGRALFAFEPRASLIDWDAGVLWDNDLLAARRAGDAKKVTSILDVLLKEPSEARMDRPRLAVNLQTASAYVGDPRVVELQPAFGADDPGAWRTASYAARFIAGAAPVAGQAPGPPVDALKPWLLINGWRGALAEATTGKALSQAFDEQDREIAPDTQPLPAVRHELMDSIGIRLMDTGIGGSVRAAYGFILHNKSQFSARLVWSAAIRNTFFGAPLYVAVALAVATSLILALLGGFVIWWMEVLRKSYQLTFTPYHWNDRRRADDEDDDDDDHNLGDGAHA